MRNSLLCAGLILFLLLSAAVVDTKPASAMLRLHQDAPGQMQYHSQESLQDQFGHAWQVVLFKQSKSGEPPSFHLRLVGFPNLVEFAHPKPLEIVTKSGQLQIVADVFGEKSPALNVGEYNCTDVIKRLGKDYLKLSLPVKGENIFLEIPPALITEWQWLVDNI